MVHFLTHHWVFLVIEQDLTQCKIFVESSDKLLFSFEYSPKNLWLPGFLIYFVLPAQHPRFSSKVRGYVFNTVSPFTCTHYRFQRNKLSHQLHSYISVINFYFDTDTEPVNGNKLGMTNFESVILICTFAYMKYWHFCGMNSCQQYLIIAHWNKTDIIYVVSYILLIFYISRNVLTLAIFHQYTI